MFYTPTEKLCIYCKTKDKNVPVFTYKQRDMTIHSYNCAICFVDEHMNENKNKNWFDCGNLERKFNLKLEHRFHLQLQYNDSYKTIVKTDVVDQESLRIVEENELTILDIMATLEKVDSELFMMLNYKNNNNNNTNKNGHSHENHEVSDKFIKISFV